MSTGKILDRGLKISLAGPISRKNTIAVYSNPARRIVKQRLEKNSKKKLNF